MALTPQRIVEVRCPLYTKVIMKEISAESREVLPYSHRCAAWKQYLITIGSAIAVAFIGTLEHRAGAAYNIPYGLVLAFLLIIGSAWCARSRNNNFGLAVHLTVSTLIIYFLSMPGPGSDILTPIGFNTDTLPWICQHCGVLWIFGALIIQLIMLMLPKGWFVLSSERTQPQEHTDTKHMR